MAKFCGKCGRRLDEKSGICLFCAQLENKKTKNKSKRNIILIILMVIVSLMFLLGLLVYYKVVDIPYMSTMENINTEYGQSINKLKEINDKCILIEENEVIMKSDVQGIAHITINMPNYKLLFQKAKQTDKPEEYIMNALLLEDYEIVKFEEKVEVTVENGKTVVHSEKRVNQVLEKELINAINVLTMEE